LRVVVTSQANRELLAVMERLGEENLTAALRFIQAFDETTDLLAQNPDIGIRWPGKRHEGIRYRSIRGFEVYLIFYRSSSDTLTVAHVLHGHRDLPRILDENDSA